MVALLQTARVDEKAFAEGRTAHELYVVSAFRRTRTVRLKPDTTY
jgi:hypothetical protein